VVTAARWALAAVIVLAASGCMAVEYAPAAERAVYLTAKDSTYCLWRLEAVSLGDLNRARPCLEAVHAALCAANEEELDRTILEFLAARVDEAADPHDRAIIKELVAAAIDDLKLRGVDFAADRRRRTALLVIGGILDGIAYANAAAGEGM
jgi:hypothetical protein